jgi:hypothetical protein
MDSEEYHDTTRRLVAMTVNEQILRISKTKIPY